MTLVVLALDALDAELVEYFDIDAYRLGTSREIGTYTNNFDGPYTLEVWPTVATGLDSREHGVAYSDNTDMEWDSPLLEAASYVTAHFPHKWRNQLGNIAEDVLGAECTFEVTDKPTMFDGEGRIVHNWPGVANPRELNKAWDCADMKGEEALRGKFERELLGLAASQITWAREMLNHDVVLAGVHVHALDLFGHAYCRDEHEDRYERLYRRVGEYVQEVSDALSSDDDLLILSDHGIQVSWLDDAEPERHSYRAYASTTIDDELFEDVFGVKDWVESHIDDYDPDREKLNLPEERLRQLGYIT